MEKSYKPLPLYSLQAGVSFHRPRQELPDRVAMDSAALFVMTDLRRVPAITIEANVPLASVLKTMIRESVRLLLVTDANRIVLGLITATDVQGAKPMRFLGRTGGTYGDILVQHIMTPHERLEVLLMEDVLKSSVGDIVATLKRAGRQHALVVDQDPNTERETIRGIFSTSQISLQLGVPIETIGVARSFAELEAALNI